MKSIALATLALLSLSGCATTPHANVASDSSVHGVVKTRHFRVGDLVVNSPPYRIAADVPTTFIEGDWLPNHKYPLGHAWRISVERRDAAPTALRIAKATKGDDAGLDRVGNYMFARFDRKTFSWGRGVSYFTQSSQDMGGYPPHNGHLTYEVWGVTNDLRYVIHLRASLTHPKLPTWPDVRTTRSQKELYADRDYLMVSTCPESVFTPSLSSLDALLDTLKIE